MPTRVPMRSARTNAKSYPDAAAANRMKTLISISRDAVIERRAPAGGPSRYVSSSTPSPSAMRFTKLL